MMHRHLIAGALACLGSNLFGQNADNTVNQTQGEVNKVQSTLQNGIQNSRDTLDKNVQQEAGSSVLSNGSNRPTLNSQNQIGGTTGLQGNQGVQSNTNLQSNLDGQSRQLNSNGSAQFQGQSNLRNQQSVNGVPQDPSYQNTNTYQANGNSGFQSNSVQGQNMQAGQLSNQGWNRNAIQNSSSIQNGARMQSGGSVPSDNLQSSLSTQNSGPVYMLRYDVNGREFICVNGRPVYFDNVNSVSAQGNLGNQNQYRAGYGNYDLKNSQNNQVPSRDRVQSQQQNSRSGLESRSFDNNSFGVEQSNPRETNLRNSEKGVDSSGQIQTGSDKQNDSQVIRNETNSRTDLNANSDSTKPSAIPSAEVPPKF